MYDEPILYYSCHVKQAEEIMIQTIEILMPSSVLNQRIWNADVDDVFIPKRGRSEDMMIF